MKFKHLLTATSSDPIRRQIQIESYPRTGESILNVAAEHEELLNIEAARSGNLGRIVYVRTRIITEIFLEEMQDARS